MSGVRTYESDKTLIVRQHTPRGRADNRQSPDDKGKTEQSQVQIGTQPKRLAATAAWAAGAGSGGHTPGRARGGGIGWVGVRERR